MQSQIHIKTKKTLTNESCSILLQLHNIKLSMKHSEATADVTENNSK